MRQLFDEAKRYIPGGVNSPVRAFRAVGGTPVFFERGHGARVRDAEGKEYIDYVGSWGPLIAGHTHPRVVAALTEQAALGTSFGAPCELETELARMICERVTGCERVRFVSSGTEAAMSAIRLARGVTGRDEIVKVDGCYHGHADSLLVQAGSGVATLAIPGSPGVPDSLAALTHVVPFNDAEAISRLLAERAEKIACVILEPVAGNMGVIPPAAGYLESVREATRRHSVVMILDEVMTGFRVHRGCAQVRFGIEPDLSCFGKVIGGGLPAAAYGGKAELMSQVAPDGPIYQAGTLSGNPLAMRAGIETLRLLDEPGAYDLLERSGARLETELARVAKDAGVDVTINRVGSMLTVFFTKEAVIDFTSAKAGGTDRFAAFFGEMLARGVYLPPSAFEAWFVSLAHGDTELDRTVEAAGESFAAVGRRRWSD
jgi:glutamate-1-semialdehyde 2,1-aminomutase